MKAAAVCACAILLGPGLLRGQDVPQDGDVRADLAPFDRATVVQRGCAILLEMQEGEGRREWPYEGVYRVREPGSKTAVIPLGYRVGGELGYRVRPLDEILRRTLRLGGGVGRLASAPDRGS